MSIIGIIPARYSSSRFPGKPLVEINGKTMLQRVYEQTKKESANLQASSGTGFFITKTGHIITNNHVIDQCNLVNAYYNGEMKQLKIIAIDRKNDLAILKGELKPTDSFAIAKEDGILLEEIYVAGYPFGKNVSGSIKVTKGVISSLSGIGNNYSNIQIDASLQPGNSGGPLFDQNGNLVGVVNAGILEANSVGYAIKCTYLNNFLDTIDGIEFPKSTSLIGKPFTTQVEMLSKICGIVTVKN